MIIPFDELIAFVTRWGNQEDNGVYLENKYLNKFHPFADKGMLCCYFINFSLINFHSFSVFTTLLGMADVPATYAYPSLNLVQQGWVELQVSENGSTLPLLDHRRGRGFSVLSVVIIILSFHCCRVLEELACHSILSSLLSHQSDSSPSSYVQYSNNLIGVI